MNFSPETVKAAREVADASVAHHPLPVNAKLRVREKAFRRVWAAWCVGYDAGLSGDEMAVLNYASHPWRPTWVKEYIAGRWPS